MAAVNNPPCPPMWLLVTTYSLTYVFSSDVQYTDFIIDTMIIILDLLYQLSISVLQCIWLASIPYSYRV